MKHFELQFILISLAASLALACGCPQNTLPTHKNNTTMLITEKEALEIAQADAQIAYQDLTVYKVDAHLENDNWVIAYAPKQGRGGGPHYVISGTDGSILNKVYYQ